MKFLQEFDCSSEETRTKFVVFYSDKMGNEQPVQSLKNVQLGDNGEFSPTVPGTAGHYELQGICKLKPYSEAVRQAELNTRKTDMDEHTIVAHMKALADQLAALRRSPVAVVLIEPADEAYDQVAPQLVMEDVCCSPTGSWRRAFR